MIILCIYTYIRCVYLYIRCVYVWMDICIYVYMYICIYIYMYMYMYLYMYMYMWMYICIYMGLSQKLGTHFFPRFGHVNVSKIISPVERVPFTMEVFSMSRAESACAQYGARNGLVEGALGSNEKNSSHRFA